MNKPQHIGDQNLTLLEQAKGAAAKQALDQVAEGEKAMTAEVTTDGTVEASVHAPVKGFTVAGFVRAPLKTLKQAVAGVRVSKKF